MNEEKPRSATIGLIALMTASTLVRVSQVSTKSNT